MVNFNYERQDGEGEAASNVGLELDLGSVPDSRIEILLRSVPALRVNDWDNGKGDATEGEARTASAA
jgi:hypothetical protein